MEETTPARVPHSPLFAPLFAIVRKVWGVMEAVGQRISRVIALILIVGVYALAICPLALVLRVMGTKTLDDAWLPNALSHWQQRAETPLELERFRRQF